MYGTYAIANRTRVTIQTFIRILRLADLEHGKAIQMMWDIRFGICSEESWDDTNDAQQPARDDEHVLIQQRDENKPLSASSNPTDHYNHVG